MKAAQIICFVMLMLIAMAPGKLQAQNITLIQQGKNTSIRGLSVVNDSIAWLSGSNGYIAATLNGGNSWHWLQVKGFEKADFRDIEAFSATQAIIMSSGTPALILKTTDGGNSWQLKYKNTDTAYFLDAMDFDGKNHGLVLGDPIKNKFLLMETTDGGETWAHFRNEPVALPGEACFAASGTCLRIDESTISIVTGGNYSRELVLHMQLNTDFWSYSNLALKHGKSSQGAFSLSNSSGVIVGGDYKNENSTDSVANFLFYNGTYAGVRLFITNKPPSGFQSSVEHLQDDTYISTGTPGSNLTTDGGKTWKKIGDNSYNVCCKAKNGKLVLLAGNNGCVGVFHP